MTTTLLWNGMDTVTLAAALEKADLTDAKGMVSTTAWHGFVTVTGTTLTTPTGPIDPSTVFEARFFASGPIELRWVHDHNGAGTAVLLSENPNHPESTEVHTTFEQTHLLWGTPDGTPGSGWTTLREHRTGPLHVPISLTTKSGDRVALTTREYIVLDDYGNASVADELITGIQWQPTDRWEADQ
ncbi:CRISPR-associated protein Csx19 [Crossiella sp. SN42]|uniref:type III-D CRISPR-associated protein Csx19 n=1 Tax=Crossiella sp. SN42 TaxID=2944808 RepID=UPI00207CC6E9|nr:CRISPR-associated protein Csx19 [Crossiella sp. SN42]MCO1575114.1 CRISPR-associated protein Csx19 [Crossiella sp. SN42]